MCHRCDVHDLFIVMQEISIKDYFKYLASTWKLSALIILAGLAGGLVYSYIQVPMYQTTSKVVVTTPTTSSTREATLGNYVELLKSQTVLGDAAEAINVTGIDVNALQESLTVKNEKNTDVISIEYVTRDETNGEYVVHETIQSFKNAMYDLYGIEGEGINIINQPHSSNTPYNVELIKQIAIGFGIGVAMALVVAFIRFDMLNSDEQKKASEADSWANSRLTPEQKRIQKLEMKQKKLALEAGISEEEARKARAESETAAARSATIESEVDSAKKEIEIAKAKKEAAFLLAEEAEKNALAENIKIKAAIATDQLNSEKEEVGRQAELAKSQADLDLKKANARMEIEATKEQQRVKREIMDAKIANDLMVTEAKANARARRAEIRDHARAKMFGVGLGRSHGAIGVQYDAEAKQRILDESQIRIAKAEADIEEKTREKIARKQAKRRVREATKEISTGTSKGGVKSFFARISANAKKTYQSTNDAFPNGEMRLKRQRAGRPWWR